MCNRLRNAVNSCMSGLTGLPLKIRENSQNGCLFCRIGIILNGEKKSTGRKSVRGILSSATAAEQYSCGIQAAEGGRNRGRRCSSETCAAKWSARRLIARA